MELLGIVICGEVGVGWVLVCGLGIIVGLWDGGGGWGEWVRSRKRGEYKKSRILGEFGKGKCREVFLIRGWNGIFVRSFCESLLRGVVVCCVIRIVVVLEKVGFEELRMRVWGNGVLWGLLVGGVGFC